MPKYTVNWKIKGLVPGKKYLNTGDAIELSEEQAARGMEVGSLSLLIEKSTAISMSEAGGAPGVKEPQEPPGLQKESIDISTYTKAQLVEYALQTFGLSLDITKTKAELFAAISEAADQADK